MNQIELIPMSPLDAGSDNASEGTETFVPENVCAKMIRYAVEEGKLTHIDFTGGCDGNLTAISKLLVGMPVEEVIAKLRGITCGRKDTSCVDQLCLALKAHAAS